MRAAVRDGVQRRKNFSPKKISEDFSGELQNFNWYLLGEWQKLIYFSSISYTSIQNLCVVAVQYFVVDCNFVYLMVQYYAH